MISRPQCMCTSTTKYISISHVLTLQTTFLCNAPQTIINLLQCMPFLFVAVSAIQSAGAGATYHALGTAMQYLLRGGGGGVPPKQTMGSCTFMTHSVS